MSGERFNLDLMSAGSTIVTRCIEDGEIRDEILAAVNELLQTKDGTAAAGALLSMYSLILSVRDTMKRVEDIAEKVEPVFYALNLLLSGDAGPDRLKFAIQKFNEEHGREWV